MQSQRISEFYQKLGDETIHRKFFSEYYFAARKYVIDEVIKYKNPYPYLGGLILRITRSVANVEITHHDRIDGKTTYTLNKLIDLWVNGFHCFFCKTVKDSEHNWICYFTNWTNICILYHY